MADKFLNTGGGSGGSISNGSINAYLASVTLANLDPSMPVKTNSVNTIISTKLDISDVNNLENRLDSVITNPYLGTLVATDFETDNYFSVNNELQKIDNFTASGEVPDSTNITGILNVDEISTSKIFDPAQQTFIELDGATVEVSANDLTLNGASVLTSNSPIGDVIGPISVLADEPAFM